ncbi:hypothetical protein LTR85_005021 [Meristemomyces frigidus]|nr:hypothetical protein LTR85_005021 [Meristemomyces frigidus]
MPTRKGSKTGGVLHRPLVSSPLAQYMVTAADLAASDNAGDDQEVSATASSPSHLLDFPPARKISMNDAALSRANQVWDSRPPLPTHETGNGASNGATSAELFTDPDGSLARLEVSPAANEPGKTLGPPIHFTPRSRRAQGSSEGSARLPHSQGPIAGGVLITAPSFGIMGAYKPIPGPSEPLSWSPPLLLGNEQRHSELIAEGHRIAQQNPEGWRASVGERTVAEVAAMTSEDILAFDVPESSLTLGTQIGVDEEQLRSPLPAAADGEERFEADKPRPVLNQAASSEKRKRPAADEEDEMGTERKRRMIGDPEVHPGPGKW